MRLPLALLVVFSLPGLGAGCAVYPPAVFCQVDSDCDTPVTICDQQTHRCRDPLPGECVEEVAGTCLDGIIYWVDSCGRLGRQREVCDCGCRDEQSCEPCECTSNSDCTQFGQNYYCDPFLHACACATECAGRCCGDDGCGGSCAQACPPGTRCQPDDCICVQDCQPLTCEQIGAQCGQLDDGCGGWIECGPEHKCQGAQAMVCADGAWRLDADCGALDQQCLNGVCVPADGLCPDGQVCDPIDDTGLLGCTLPDGGWPPDTQFDCGQYGLCEGEGAFCHFLSGVTACVRECGTCPADQECSDVSGTGFFACITPDGTIPPDTPTGCQANQDCPGNRLCWCLDAGCADTVCLENCSPQP